MYNIIGTQNNLYTDGFITLQVDYKSRQMFEIFFFHMVSSIFYCSSHFRNLKIYNKIDI